MFIFDDHDSVAETKVSGSGLTDKDANKAASKAAKTKGEEIIKKVIERDIKFKLL
jgi:hypothetical protein